MSSLSFFNIYFEKNKIKIVLLIWNHFNKFENLEYKLVISRRRTINFFFPSINNCLNYSKVANIYNVYAKLEWCNENGNWQISKKKLKWKGEKRGEVWNKGSGI